MNDTKIYQHNLIWFIPIGFLLLSFFPMPIGYYSLLRLIITISAFYLAYLEYGKSKSITIFSVIFVIVGLLFNPIFKIYFHRYQWQTIDVVVLVIYVVHYLKRKKDEVWEQ